VLSDQSIRTDGWSVEVEAAAAPIRAGRSRIRAVFASLILRHERPRNEAERAAVVQGVGLAYHRQLLMVTPAGALAAFVFATAVARGPSAAGVRAWMIITIGLDVLCLWSCAAALARPQGGGWAAGRTTVLRTATAVAWSLTPLYLAPGHGGLAVWQTLCFTVTLSMAGTTVFAGRRLSFALWAGPLLLMTPVVGVAGGIITGWLGYAVLSFTAGAAVTVMFHVSSVYLCRTLLADHRHEVLVEDLRASERRLAHDATHDVLTGLANRQQLMDCITAALHRDGTCPAVLFIDLDRFKAVNDTFGHAAGDRLLQTVAHRLTDAVGAGDVCARLGGDEFVVFLEHSADVADVVRVGNRIIEAIEQPVDGIDLDISASVGLSVASIRTASASELLTEADTAMYRAKEMGRRRVLAFDDDMQRAVDESLRDERALRRALADRDLRAFAMPLVDLGTGRLIGFELLCRWLRPGVGLMAPEQFIPLAERCGLVGEIDRWMLAEALTLLESWQPIPDLSMLALTVNASAQLLEWGVIPADIAARSGRFDPSRLLLELTESVAMRDVHRVSAQLRALSAMGVRSAIDDFGTGYSSLSYLRDFPVTGFKIDRSFLAQAVEDERGVSLLETLVELGRAFGLRVVAEGCETETHARLAAAVGCPVGQGYYFGAPVPVDEAVRDWRRQGFTMAGWAVSAGAGRGI
jgi:diguanylate cyclase (GGDEF)-like protein